MKFHLHSVCYLHVFKSPLNHIFENVVKIKMSMLAIQPADCSTCL